MYILHAYMHVHVHVDHGRIKHKLTHAIYMHKTCYAACTLYMHVLVHTSSIKTFNITCHTHMYMCILYMTIYTHTHTHTHTLQTGPKGVLTDYYRTQQNQRRQALLEEKKRRELIAKHTATVKSYVRRERGREGG